MRRKRGKHGLRGGKAGKQGKTRWGEGWRDADTRGREGSGKRRRVGNEESARCAGERDEWRSEVAEVEMKY